MTDSTSEDTGVRTTHLPEGGWLVSQHGTWVTGVYDSPSAAIAAVDADPSELDALWESKRGSDGTITVELTEAEVMALKRA